MHRIVIALSAALIFGTVLQGREKKADWVPLPVPGLWEDVSEGRFAKLDGFAWYRCWVKVPPAWKGTDLTLAVDRIRTAYEAYWDGTLLGGAGSLPPKYRDGSSAVNSFTIPAKNIRAGEYHLLALRVYEKAGKGGFYSLAPAVVNESRAISLAGRWQFRPGDDLAWAQPGAPRPEDHAAFFKEVDVTAQTQVKTHEGGLKPADAAKSFTVPADLRFDQVLAEPIVAQPLSATFDEKGRLWVVQYRQYPNPAGLKMLSRDIWWRAVYDKVPPPPPHHFRGKDRITIHEDTDGDGVFDKHATFVDGLNIATAAVRGRGGVWVLNPPYLLFYPTKDNADRPTGDPVVHLQGFGLEDTHSVTNSLTWGPDGWLYAAQGSTVTGKVQRPGSKEVVQSFGQNIWRYHPEKRRYEVFAEGGGNAFGVEIDARGRLFSGHNGGNTRGFHYVQGGYYRKGFDKHGPLSNPYTFGFFEAMKSNNAPRFSHDFAVYEGGSLPEKYRGRIFAVVPLQQHVMLSETAPDGSSLRTKDLGPVVTSKDSWFRPVAIEHGPDGALYVADWYDGQIAHLFAHTGKMDNDTGRIYRLAGKNHKPIAPFDLNKKSSADLLALLAHPNRWFRQTALRLLGDRRDEAVVPAAQRLCLEGKGNLALNALWAVNLSGGFDEAFALQALNHAEPDVRSWAVRLLGDDNQVTTPMARRLADLAEKEQDVEVRVQLACSARRLPPDQCLPIVARLLRHDEDAADIHQPLLLWWALERHCDKARDQVLKSLAADLWARPLVRDTILPRLMRRFAVPGTLADLHTCLELFKAAPSKEAGKALLKGFEEAFQGRTIAGLPRDLLLEIDRLGGGSLAFAMRLGRKEAIEQGLQQVQDPKAAAAQREQMALILGEIREPRSVPVLLAMTGEKQPTPLRRAALAALQNFGDDAIGTAVVAGYAKMSGDLRDDADALLSSRRNWARTWLQAVDQGALSPRSIGDTALKKILLHQDKALADLVRKHWGEIKGATTAQMKQEIDRLLGVTRTGTGSPYDGKQLFTQKCAVCHFLHNHGGKVGPNLTPFKRDDTAHLLLHIVNPSAEIREGFENHLVVTESGRVLTGVLLEKDARVVVLLTPEDRKVVVPTEEVAEMRAIGISLMPEGLLHGLADQQVRDLFAYLRSTQPLYDR